MTDASVRTDQKAGWSTYCRGGNHDQCARVVARCTCDCHGGAQEPAAARAVGHDARLAILRALVAEDGSVAHAGGRAASVLASIASLEDRGVSVFTSLLSRMEDDGLIERDTRGTKTYDIAITDKGEAFLNDTEPAATKETPTMAEPARALAAVTAHEDDDDGLVWADPPRGRSKDPILTASQERALRARPNSWARVRVFPGKTSANTTAMKCKKGEALVPEGTWEYRAAKHGDGSALYVRFLDQ